MEMQPPNNTSTILSEKEIRRYTHQINTPEIGLVGQEKLKQSKVLVVGAGGLGASILQSLAATGVGKIGISDNAHVKERDLSHQHLYGNGDLGKQKAIISREKLREQNPLIDYQLHNVYLSDSNINTICEPYQLVVGAVNKLDIQQLIGSALNRQYKPGILIHIKGSEIGIATYNYKNGVSADRIIGYMASKAAQIKDKNWTCRISLHNMAASIVSSEIVRILLGMETNLQNHIFYADMRSYKFHLDEVK